MSDDSSPINPNARKRSREHAAGEAAHLAGEAFSFTLYEYDDDGIGTIDTGEIVVVLDALETSGIRMREKDALWLAAALVQAVATSPYRAEPASRK